MNNGIYKKGLAVVLTITIIILTAIGVKLSTKEKEIDNVIYNDTKSAEEEEMFNDEVVSNDIKNKTDIIVVDIDGAVKNPGVYELVEGDRVDVAIKKAGGLSDTAYTKNINKARLLVDGEKIYIQEESEINSDVVITDDSVYNIEGVGAINKKININTASKELLMSLDGIGEVYSQRIIEYRDEVKFITIEEVKKVKGIGEKTFENIKDKITVD